jgi:hypothetical protein
MISGKIKHTDEHTQSPHYVIMPVLNINNGRKAALDSNSKSNSKTVVDHCNFEMCQYSDFQMFQECDYLITQYFGYEVQ